MRVLSISAQKPNSTGSGVYLTEVVKALKEAGHEQAVVGGVFADDEVTFPERVEWFPVTFKTEALPFPIVGMSDEMPYENTRYRDMTEEMVTQFHDEFIRVIREAIESFEPDLIVCHHLYLLTAMVREAFPDQVIVGFCHNTDLRQFEKIDLAHDYLMEQIPKLDFIFSLQKAQKERIIKDFDIPENKIQVVGMGYNSQIFKKLSVKKDESKKHVIYVGKIAEKKGVMSLIRSLSYLQLSPEEVDFVLYGGAGNKEEYEEIVSMATESPYEIFLPGKASQETLAVAYNKSDVFVLPSFSEGLPLTPVEALACGANVVMTDLPGIKEWLEEYVSGGSITYIAPPEMVNVDETVPESLPFFEQELARALEASLCDVNCEIADTSKISWKGIAGAVITWFEGMKNN